MCSKMFKICLYLKRKETSIRLKLLNTLIKYFRFNIVDFYYRNM